MTNETYNGWTNYATWRVMLEMFDGIDTAEYFDLNQEAYDLGIDLKSYAIEMVEQSVNDPRAPSLALDYAFAFLNEVNWWEIAKHLINEKYIEKA